jgi:N-formylglutamate deformylase
MTQSLPPWLTVERRSAPLVISLPHTGIDLPSKIASDLVSPWLARKDTDWWIDKLYGFARELGATFVHTALSRTVIDVNRDPSGISLYPGQATTELCPTTTFDGEPLYHDGCAPDVAAVAVRKGLYFEPYHEAVRGELTRLRGSHARVVLYDCHSIRSVIPRLFEGELPQFNIGTNGGAGCDAELAKAVHLQCDVSGYSSVLNGRFKGGHITRHYGNPQAGIHAVQMELACRGYMHEPVGPVHDANWPPPYDPGDAAKIQVTLQGILETCLRFAKTSP